MKMILASLKKSTLFTFLLGITMILMGILSYSYAALTPNSTVSFTSSTLNYNDLDAGSWKVTKSAEWIRSDQIDITFQVSSIMQKAVPHKNYVFILDTAASLSGENFQKFKDASISLAKAVLENSNHTISIITFNEEPLLFLEPTNNLQNTITAINQISTEGQQTNFYKAFQKLTELFQNYDFVTEDCQVVFISDGYSTIDSPNEYAEYRYLKSEYPNILFSAIQYAMPGTNSIIEQFTSISDISKLANANTIESVLLQLCNVASTYQSFIIDDIISDSFLVSGISSVSASKGQVSLEEIDGKQHVIWNLNDEYVSGFNEELHIVADFSSSTETIMRTNDSTTIQYSINNVEENKKYTDSPVLATSYSVKFVANAPDGCTVSDMPSSFSNAVFEVAKIGDKKPSCNGYTFQGWKMKETDTMLLNDDYFIMPSHDVTLIATWSNFSVKKSMEGEVYSYQPPIIQQVPYNYTGEFWKYRSQISKIVLQNSFEEITGAIEAYDISASKNGSVKAYLTLNSEDSSTYIVYIQGDGKLIANQNSSYLFYSFSNLTSIEGLEYLDTSNVTSMGSMFANDTKLTNLDVSHFDTSKVTDFSFMFAWCEALISLDVSNFVTSSATNMQYMFCNCNTLTSLDVSNFDLSKVIYMAYMFSNCGSLTTINLTNFKTQSAKDMSYMFNNCSRLTGLDLSSFVTSNVTNMSYMFYNCQSITELNLSNFDTSKVTTMAFMFAYSYFIKSIDVSSFNTANVVDMRYLFASCNYLETLDLSKWNTSKVTNMSYMFNYCQELQSLDLSNFDTSKVVNMERMFRHCEALTSLNITGWNTSNVTTMYEMFAFTSSLSSLNVSSFNTSKVTTMQGMFMSASKLETLDISNFNTANVTNMSDLFASGDNKAMALKSIIFGSGFSLQNVTTMEAMFYYDSNLTSINFPSGLSAPNLQNVSYMFCNCANLTSYPIFYIGSNDGSGVNYSYMFASCWSLKSVDIQYFNFTNSNTSYMFYNCSTLSELNQRSGVQLYTVTDTSYMFYNCSSLYVNNLYLPDTGLTAYEHMLTGVQGASIHYTSYNEAIVDAIIADANNSNITKM